MNNDDDKPLGANDDSLNQETTPVGNKDES